MRSYSSLIELSSFDDRFNYLKLSGRVGDKTFGVDRYLNQKFYTSTLWKQIREEVILRDKGLDLGCSGHQILGSVFVHHMNPIELIQLTSFDQNIINKEQLICCSFETHQAIHYSSQFYLKRKNIVREKNDTKLW